MSGYFFRRALPALVLTLSAVVAATGPSPAQEIHSALCLHGCPAGGAASNDVVVREIYILSSNDDTKFADWVAYKVTVTSQGSTSGLRRVWKKDPVLGTAETLDPADYKDANKVLGTDRGHQAPFASFAGTGEAVQDTNYLSNITPQKKELNQGPWRLLEDAVRKAAAGRDVYVMTGPLYERQMPPLPGTTKVHRVPSGYWKVVAVEDGGTIRLAAFVMDQETGRREDFCTKGVTAAEVERRSGLDFFHALAPADQDALETGPPALMADLGCPAAQVHAEAR